MDVPTHRSLLCYKICLLLKKKKLNEYVANITKLLHNINSICTFPIPKQMNKKIKQMNVRITIYDRIHTKCSKSNDDVF